MSGFTLYETLRIFLPGAAVIFVADVVARIAYGPSPVSADGGAASFVGALESPAIAIPAAILVGLLLYAIDLPVRLRMYQEGDQEHDLRLPSKTLKSHLAGTGLDEDRLSFRLYFLLSDKYLPLESHRRVYLFGSLFRVFADLRFILAAATLTGVAMTTLRLTETPTLASSLARIRDGYQPLVLAALAIALTGLFGVRSHALNDRRKNHTPYLARLGRDLKIVLGPAVVIVLLEFTATILLTFPRSGVRLLGGIAAFAELAMWVWVEVGPPALGGDRPREELDWRSRILEGLSASYDRVQYTPLQRTVADLALFLPWLVIATVVDGGMVNAPIATTWLVLIVPCTGLMAIAKHENRQLQAFELQSVWLDLHSGEIQRVGQSAQLPDTWS